MFPFKDYVASYGILFLAGSLHGSTIRFIVVTTLSARGEVSPPSLAVLLRSLWRFSAEFSSGDEPTSLTSAVATSG